MSYHTGTNPVLNTISFHNSKTLLFLSPKIPTRKSKRKSPTNRLIVERAMRFILTSTNEKILTVTPGDVAAEVGMNCDALDHFFLQTRKLSVEDSILREKMHRAYAAIVNNLRLSNIELASSLGFDTPETFSNAFEKYFCIQPDRLAELVNGDHKSEK